MPPEVLASAFDSNARTEQPLQKGCGLALCNVMSRVRYFFDFRSGIDIQSTLGEGTTVRFKLVGAPRRSKTAE